MREKHGDKILAMDLSMGGHLSHGSPANWISKIFNVSYYGCDKETGLIDYEELERLAHEIKPQLIICGASSSPSQPSQEHKRHAAVFPLQVAVLPQLGILLHGTAGGVVKDGEPLPRQIGRNTALNNSLLQIAAAGGADTPALAGGAVAVDQLHQGRVHLPGGVQLRFQPAQRLVYCGSPLLQIQFPYGHRAALSLLDNCIIPYLPPRRKIPPDMLANRGGMGYDVGYDI